MSAANIILGATGGGNLLRLTTFTSSGTWTKQADVARILVYVVGGGAGGNGATSTASSFAGGSGGTSSFGVHCSASGAPGGLTTSTYGIGSGGDINLRGSGSVGNTRYMASAISNYTCGLKGGDSIFGGGGLGYPGSSSTGAGAGLPGVNGGGGGGAGYRDGVNNYHCQGGGSGGCAIKLIQATSLGSTVTVTIGAGGSASGGAQPGGAGGAGIVVIYEYGY